MTAEPDTIVYLPEVEIGSRLARTAPKPELNEEAAINRFCILLSDAATDTQTSIMGLKEEAEAMRTALEALRRILDTLKMCSEHFLARFDESGSEDAELVDLARPMRLAASTALAVNANIAASSNALAEASLRIIRVGEHCIEASRLAPKASTRR